MITPKYIKHLVEKELKTENIQQKTRKRNIVFCRCVYFKLCSVFCSHSQEIIAKEMGGMDHASVVHGNKMFSKYISDHIFTQYYNAYLKISHILKIEINLDKEDFKAEDIYQLIKQYEEREIKLKKAYEEKIINIQKTNIPILKEINEFPIERIKEFEKLCEVWYKNTKRKMQYDNIS